MIRVLVIDDHPVVSQGLVAVLGDHEDLDVTATSGVAVEALAAVERLHPDVVLLDLELSDASGLDLLPRILGASPLSRVLIFTAYDSDERVFGALDAGAQGYLLKGTPVADVVAAIRGASRGAAHLDPRVATRVLSRMRSPGLTARQREILRLVARGLSNRAIAEAVGLSERTVKFHLATAFNKLGAENRAQAVALAGERGLL